MIGERMASQGIHEQLSEGLAAMSRSMLVPNR
jgi:hypothetical protein